MKKLLLIAAAATVCTGVLAQNNEMNKEVEVTKEYMPDVNRATKLFIAPRMIDTVTLRPEIDYSIRPMPWLGSFGVAAINPIKVQSTEFTPTTPFYIKAGIGYPMNSVLDAYATGGNGKTSYYGVALNHTGDFYKIKNELGERKDATKTTNHIGVFGLYNNSRRFWVGGQLSFDYDLYTPYAGYTLNYKDTDSSDPTNPNLVDASMPIILNDKTRKYSTPQLNFWFGNDFRDMSLFNVRGYVNTYYLGAGKPILEDKTASEFGLNIGADLGKTINGIHTLMLNVDVQYYKPKNNSILESNTILTFSPYYAVNLGMFDMLLGADIVMDNNKSSNNDYYKDKTHIFPNVELKLNLANEYIVPFVIAKGFLSANNMRNTALRCPYVLAGTLNQNTSTYDFSAGIAGVLAPQFGYRIYAGYDIIRDYQYFRTVRWPNTEGMFDRLDSVFSGEYITNTANAMIPKFDRFKLGFEIDGKFGRGFSYDLAAHYYSYDVKKSDSFTPNQVVGLPDYDATLNLIYRLGGKFRARIGATLLGKRTEYTALQIMDADWNSKIILQSDTVDPVVDINAAVEMQVSKMTSIFLEGHNLGGSKLYYYPHFNSVGATCTAGVKLCF